ncbi:hypothetical protein OCF84_21555 (plasmid) [Shewanella xiamenensis]|uniref:Uncharacterized protein n=1 Tax=Shewanella xiamenensis TaxID=332186 RepID=A0ABT6UDI5_9GAMM|nr:hypothetical protein [Shewanella xiamenensis]MDI5832536.1 hypothetical protein [Shewanella xiamenensis]WHF57846.1 hypothetical protein OCF84_21555 [Shewanella xiamenensis]
MESLPDTTAHFFCDACNKPHRETAGNRTLTVTDIKGNSIDLNVCDLQMFKYSEQLSKSFIIEEANLKTMVGLKAKILKAESNGEDTFKYRVGFAIMAFSSTLYQKLISNDLLEKHGIDKHFFDSCFQMGDVDLVIREIMHAAKNDFWLDVQIRRALPNKYVNWKEYQ